MSFPSLQTKNLIENQFLWTLAQILAVVASADHGLYLGFGRGFWTHALVCKLMAGKGTGAGQILLPTIYKTSPRTCKTDDKWLRYDWNDSIVQLVCISTIS